MESFYEQIMSLLINPPGNMIYHIVLAFAVTAALQGILISRRSGPGDYFGRAVFALGLVLAAQMVIFLSSGLAWQGLANPHIFLPPLDRLITLFGLLWICWLWAFPRPVRLADSLAGLATLVLVIAFFFTLSQWSAQPPPHIFNGSIFSWPWELAALVVLLAALLALVLRRPDGWGIGLGFVLLNLAGHTVEFLWPASGDFSGIVRLAQLCSYPLLPVLAQRMLAPLEYHSTAEKPVLQYKAPAPAGKTDRSAKPVVMVERRRYSADPRTIHTWLNIARETDAARLEPLLTRAVAQTMLADICFYLGNPGSSGDVVFRCGFDLIREEEIPPLKVARESLPSIASSLQHGKPYRLEGGSSTPDLKTLSERFGVGSLGGMLLISLSVGQQNLGGFLLLSPYSNRTWSIEDQNFLTTTIEPMVQLLQKSLAAPGTPAVSPAELESARQQLARLEAENRKLAEDCQRLRQPAHPELAALMAVQKDAQQTISTLQAENDHLKQAALGGSPAGGLALNDLEYLEKELREALQENARLQNQLAQSNIQLLSLQQQVEQPPLRLANEEREVVASIAQELRQPMASIIGYTELLLSESAGILGALQRKFLERVKTSIERMRSILDDLVQITSLQNGKVQLVAQPIHASEAIDAAVSETRTQLQEKNILLQVDLPDQLPELQADGDAVQQILVHLLQNAGAATPAEGVIALKVRVDHHETNRPYLLFQITDTGGGIAAEDLSRVFSRRYRADNPLIQGVGDTGVGLSIAKTLTEAHGGRIWVESENRKTTTFSVLLPIHPPTNLQAASGQA